MKKYEVKVFCECGFEETREIEFSELDTLECPECAKKLKVKSPIRILGGVNKFTNMIEPDEKINKGDIV